MSRATAIVLCLGGAVLLVVAVVGVWVQLAVLQRDSFRELAVATAQTPAVSVELAGVIWDYLDGRYGVRHTADREHAQEVLAGVLRRPMSEELLGTLADSVYGAVFGSRRADVTMALGDEFDVLEEAVNELDPELVALLPAPEELGKVVVVPAEQLPRLAAVARAMPWAAALCALMGVAFVGLGFWVAPERHLAHVTLGLGVAAAGAVVVTGSLLAPTVANSLVSEPTVAQALAAGLSELAGGLLVVGAVVFLLGVALMATAGRRSHRPAVRR